MSAETLPGALRRREALAVRRDRLAADITGRMLLGAWYPELQAITERRVVVYRALSDEIAATGEVVMGPGDWRRGRPERGGEDRGG